MNLSKEKAVMLDAAIRAGRLLLKYYGKSEKVKEKSNKSFVSKADIEANKIIIKTIKKNFPHQSILSEESIFQDKKSDYKWVIDPLDGTHNFLHSIPVFGVSIALEYKNQPILGVLNFPKLCITAFAEKGKGSFLNGKRLIVSKTKTVRHSLIVIDAGYENKERRINFMYRLMDKTVDIRNFGAAIYSLLLVASGKSDAMVIFSTHEWDIAAGSLIVTEAGGKVTNHEGKKLDFKDRSFVISNGKIHHQILKLLEK